MKIVALSVDYDWIDKAETTLKSIYARNQDIKPILLIQIFLMSGL